MCECCRIFKRTLTALTRQVNRRKVKARELRKLRRVGGNALVHRWQKGCLSLGGRKRRN